MSSAMPNQRQRRGQGADTEWKAGRVQMFAESVGRQRGSGSGICRFVSWVWQVKVDWTFKYGDKRVGARVRLPHQSTPASAASADHGPDLQDLAGHEVLDDLAQQLDDFRVPQRRQRHRRPRQQKVAG